MAEFAEEIEEIFLRLFSLGGAQVSSLGIAFNVPDEAAKLWARNHAAELVTQIRETTRERMRSVIADAVASEAGPAGLRKAIVENFAFSAKRAQLIARTEMAVAFNTGQVEALKSSGVGAVEVLDGLNSDSDAPCLDVDRMVISVVTAGQHLIQHPNCLIEGTVVLAPNLLAGYSREFHGEVVVLRTAANDDLTCTPNHPILTRNGWVPAGELGQGDEVVCCFRTDDMVRCIAPEDRQVPTSIENLFSSLLESHGMTSMIVPGTAKDFHGDGAEGDVNIVFVDSLLLDRNDPSNFEKGTQSDLPVAHENIRPDLKSIGPLHQLSVRTLNPAHSSMGPIGISAPLFRGELGGNKELLLAEIPELVSSPSEGTPETTTADSQFFREILGAFSQQVTLVKLIEVKRRRFSGHVYNLSTVQGWYLSNNIITHNCVRSFAPVVDFDGQLEDDAFIAAVM